MIKAYNKDFNREEITSENIEEYTGYVLDDWCEFTGLFIPAFPKGFIYKDEINMRGIYSKFRLFKNDSPRIQLDMEFDFFGQTIYTEEFILTNSNKGRGTLALLTHIDLATKAGFKSLLCWAFGGKEENEIAEEKKSKDKSKNEKREYFHGYITWAKLGFKMLPEYQEKFITLLKKDGRTEKDLYELLGTDDGVKYWKDNGYAWYGIFDLAHDSINRKYLKQHLASKNDVPNIKPWKLFRFFSKFGL